MSRLAFFFASLFLGCCLAGFVAAETVRLKTVPDGQVKFEASITGPTRISVVGDRIAKVLQSQSAYEMVNDEGTGDVFLRFAGSGQVQSESGYIVTESGVTIGFTMTPKTGLDVQTVLITISGTRTSAQHTSSGGFAVDSNRQATQPTQATHTVAPKTRIDRLVDFVRLAHARRIGDRSVGRLKRGVHTSYSSGGLRARIAVAQAPGGKPPDPKGFVRDRKGILSVWVDDRVVNGKVWVIIVEGRL